MNVEIRFRNPGAAWKAYRRFSDFYRSQNAPKTDRLKICNSTVTCTDFTEHTREMLANKCKAPYKIKQR